MAVPRPPRVFISYAHEPDSDTHRDVVRELWLFLRSQGIDAHLDLVAAGQRRDWALWMADQIRDADHILVVASPAYRVHAQGQSDPGVGRGVQWEARLIRDAFYRDQNALARFVPVVVPGQTIDGVPDFLAPATTTVYHVRDFTIAGAEALLRLLTGQPADIQPPLGRRPMLPSRSSRRSGDQGLGPGRSPGTQVADQNATVPTDPGNREPGQGGRLTAAARAGFVERWWRSRRARALAALLSVGVLTGSWFGIRDLVSSNVTSLPPPSAAPTGVALNDPVALQTGLVPDVAAIQFSPDGTVIATAGNADQVDDSSVRLWSAQTHQRLEVLPGVGAPIAFSPGGASIATTINSSDIVQLWDTTSYTRTTTLDLSNVNVLGFLPGTDTLAAGGTDDTIQTWDTNTGRRLNSITEPLTVEALAFGRNNEVIAAGTGTDGNGVFTAQTWNATEAKPIITLPHAVNPVGLTPGGGYLLVGGLPDNLGNPTDVEAWDTAAHRKLGVLAKDHVTYAVNGGGVTLSRDGQLIAVSDTDIVQLWRMRIDHADPSFTLLATLSGVDPDAGLTCMAFSPDSRTLAAGDNRGILRLWNIGPVLDRLGR